MSEVISNLEELEKRIMSELLYKVIIALTEDMSMSELAHFRESIKEQCNIISIDSKQIKNL